MEPLEREEAELAEEIAICQVDAELASRTNVGVVREHVTAMVDLIKLAEPEELKRLYSDLFSVVITWRSKKASFD